jgi:hypothetical protein
MGKDHRTVRGNVLIEQDANPGMAQQPRQRSLAIEEWEMRISSPSCSMRSKASVAVGTRYWAAIGKAYVANYVRKRYGVPVVPVTTFTVCA